MTVTQPPHRPSVTGPVLYPCNRGTSTPMGYHHYEAAPTGVVFCRYCGHVAVQTLRVTY